MPEPVEKAVREPLRRASSCAGSAPRRTSKMSHVWSKTGAPRRRRGCRPPRRREPLCRVGATRGRPRARRPRRRCASCPCRPPRRCRAGRCPRRAACSAGSDPIPCRDRPHPAPPGATMYSSAVVSCAAKTRFMSAFTRSTVSCSPSSSSSSPRISARRSNSRHASIAASAARCARLTTAIWATVLARRRSSKSSWSTSSSTPSARRRSASQTGKFAGTLARFSPRLPTARSESCASSSRRSIPDAISSSGRAPRAHGRRRARARGRGGLHRAHEDVPAAVLLRVEERIGHTERHRVPHVRGAEGVRVDQERVGHRRAMLAIATRFPIAFSAGP